MKAAEILTRLTDLIAEHGNLDVVNYDSESIKSISFEVDETAEFVIEFDED